MKNSISDTIITVLITVLSLGLVLLLTTGLLAFAGLLFMVAWNIVIPSAFNGPKIDLLQASAIVFLLAFVRGWPQANESKKEPNEGK